MSEKSETPVITNPAQFSTPMTPPPTSPKTLSQEELNEKKVLLDKLDEKFFQPNDVQNFYLSTLPSVLGEKFFVKEQNRLEKSLMYVDEDLSEKILQNYNSFVVGMTQIQELGNNLKETMRICSKGQETLSKTKEFVKSGLMVIKKKRRLENLKKVADILQQVKRYRHLVERIEEYLKNGNLTESVALVDKLKKTVREIGKNGKFLKFIPRTHHKYVRKIERFIWKTLKECCKKFDEKKYKILIDSIKIMKLEKEFFENIKKFYRKEIDMIISKNNLIDLHRNCYGIIESVSFMMFNYNLIYHWHKQEYKLKKISKFRTELWEKIRSRLISFLKSTDFKKMKIDNFFRVYTSLNVLFDFSSCFSTIDEKPLKTVINVISKKYFMHYHRNVIFENLMLILENEYWNELNYPFSFKILTSNLGYSQKFFNFSKNLQKSLTEKKFEVFSKLVNKGMFFDIFQEQSSETLSDEEEEGEFLSDEEEEDAELKETQIILNISKTIINKLVIYLNAMEIMKPINSTIFISFTNIINFYLYALFSMFSDNYNHQKKMKEFKSIYPEKISPTESNRKVLIFFKRVRKELNDCNRKSLINSEFPLPRITNNIQSYFDLVQRCISIESFNIIYKVCAKVKSKLKYLLPNYEENIDFFLKEISKYKQVKEMLYRGIVPIYFGMKDYESKIISCNFQSKSGDFTSNQYVNQFVRDFTDFQKRISLAPEYSKNKLWFYCVEECLNRMLMGYSKIKKCTTIGRGQMQFDFVSFQSQLKSVREKKFQWPKQVEWIQSYIGAYYFGTFEEMAEWMKKHDKVYTREQMKALVVLKAKSSDKKLKFGIKNKSKLLKLLQDLYSKEK